MSRSGEEEGRREKRGGRTEHRTLSLSDRTLTEEKTADEINE